MADAEQVDHNVYDGPAETDSQNDAPEKLNVTEPVTESVSESAGELEAANKVPPLTEEQQQVFNDAIAKKVAKQREAERKAEEIQLQLQEVKNRLANYEAPVRPNIPPVPDRYDYNSDTAFSQAVHERDALIARAAAFDAQSLWERQQEQYKQSQLQAEQQQQLKNIVTLYSGQADKLGISAEDLQNSGMKVAEYGINDRVASRILRDERGPEITVYLSRNLAELDVISGMETEDAAVYIETVIKPKARRNPPKLPSEPVDPVRGSGLPDINSGPPGATYE